MMDDVRDSPAREESLGGFDSGRMLRWLGLVGVLLLAANLAMAALAIRSGAADITGVENAVTHTTMRLALGHSLYSDPESPPFSLVQYSPLHYQMTAAAIRLFGFDPRDPVSATQIGRAMATVMWSTALCIVGVWLLRMGAGFAVAAALLGWWTTQANVWWFLNRPDSAETALLFLAIAMTVRSVRPDRVSTGWVVAASLAGVAAGYAKQNGWIASVVLIAVMVAARGLRHALLAVLATLLGHALLHGAAWYAWGSAWPRNIIGALDNGVRFDRAVLFAYQPIAYQGSAILVAACLLAWRWRRDSGGPKQALAASLAVTFLFAVVAAMKIGSADNYFIDTCGVAVLMIGAAAAELRRSNPRAIRFAAAAAILFLLLVAPIKLYESWRRVTVARTYTSTRSIAERVERLAAEHPGAWVFFEDGPVANFFPERACLPQLLLAQLAFERKTFPYKAVPGFFLHGEAAVVVLRAPPTVERSPSLRILGSSLEQFMFLEVIDGQFVYLHRRYEPPAGP